MSQNRVPMSGSALVSRNAAQPGTPCRSLPTAPWSTTPRRRRPISFPWETDCWVHGSTCPLIRETCITGASHPFRSSRRSGGRPTAQRKRASAAEAVGVGDELDPSRPISDRLRRCSPRSVPSIFRTLAPISINPLSPAMVRLSHRSRRHYCQFCCQTEHQVGSQNRDCATRSQFRSPAKLSRRLGILRRLPVRLLEWLPTRFLGGGYKNRPHIPSARRLNSSR